eukprot:3518779-Rhodomonas_salina.1
MMVTVLATRNPARRRARAGVAGGRLSSARQRQLESLTSLALEGRLDRGQCRPTKEFNTRWYPGHGTRYSRVIMSTAVSMLLILP